MSRRVVITACSAISPIGYGKKDIVAALKAGVSGVKPLRDDGLLANRIHSKVFGTVDYPIAFDFARQFRKTMGPVANYACQVAGDVLAASGLEQDFISSGRLGVAFGSTHGSPTVQRDIYRTFLRKNASQQELVWVGRIMVLLVALIDIGLASDPNAKVLGMVSYAWAGFGAAFGPVIILSVFWQGMTRNGALAGIIVGAVTVLVWKQFGWLGLYEIVPGFILCGLTVWLVSRLGQPSPTMRAAHAAVEKEFAAIGKA